MIILLFLVHTLYHNGRPIYESHLDPRAPTESCNNVNECRKLFNIIWGCLATIFACTWVSMHPNVPPPNQSRLTLFWQRLKMMLIAIIAPEIMVGFAARLHGDLPEVSETCIYQRRNFVYSTPIDFYMLRTHGFFICMGGFIGYADPPSPTKKSSVVGLNTVSVVIYADLPSASITYKSKGDALSKGVALIQGLWFTAQCVARIHQRLPVSELEATTLAFAVINIFIYALWWGKPLDVQRPILVGPQEEVPIPDPVLEYQNSSLLGHSAENLSEEEAKPWHGNFLEWVLWCTGGIIHLSTLILVFVKDQGTLTQSTRKCLKSVAAATQRNQHSAGECVLEGCRNPPLRLTALRTASKCSAKQYRVILDSGTEAWQEKFNHAFYIECLIGTIFGGIHCAAWNTDFPSIQEMWMWRSSAVAVATIPGIVAGSAAAEWFNNFDEDSAAWYIRLAFGIPFCLSFAIYPIARLFLIVLPLIALRAPPPGALTDVNWSIYIPHL
ncbi:hypothetical protein C8R43DRAFT_886723 [Mycena crocata]|nr:hypothetical protein C8R43DRAFT_886723 [Mycena crocata]